MINEKVPKKNTSLFSSEKEVSILKHFSKSKNSLLNSNKPFLYSDPPEVVFQSN